MGLFFLVLISPYVSGEMEEEELTKHCEAPSICGGVPTLNIIGETHRQSVKKVSYCVVGKVLPRKQIN